MTTLSTTAQASADRPGARLATRIAFLVAGFGLAAWAPLIPFAKARLGADDGLMGVLLLCLGAGSVAAMLRTGPLCARYGCKPVVVGSGLVLALLLPPLAVASSPWTLGAVLLTADKPAEAEAVYREDLKRWPENGWSLFGLSRALHLQGKHDEMHAVETRFQKAWAGADVPLKSTCFCQPGK